jgi:hypothetical protein
MQVVKADGQFGPVVYCHWTGSDSPEVIARLAKRMEGRAGDVDYSTARLVQEAIGGDTGNISFGVFNADAILTAADSHGDCGVILIHCDKGHAWEPLCGYLRGEWEAGKWGDHKARIHG